jgi:hypothetical protein
MTTSSVRAWTTQKFEARRLRQARVAFPPKHDSDQLCRAFKKVRRAVNRRRNYVSTFRGDAVRGAFTFRPFAATSSKIGANGTSFELRGSLVRRFGSDQSCLRGRRREVRPAVSLAGSRRQRQPAQGVTARTVIQGSSRSPFVSSGPRKPDSRDFWSPSGPRTLSSEELPSAR